MQKIKFNYILKIDEQGRKTTKNINLNFGYYEIFNGFAKEEFLRCQRLGYVIVARRLWTGLKDKNGVDIYEGDIVYEVLWTVGQTVPVYHEIRWSEPNAGFWIGTGSPLTQGATEDLEVIGNIYENPELLETKQ